MLYLKTIYHNKVNVVIAYAYRSHLLNECFHDMWVTTINKYFSDLTGNMYSNFIEIHIANIKALR